MESSAQSRPMVARGPDRPLALKHGGYDLQSVQPQSASQSRHYLCLIDLIRPDEA